MRSSLLLILFAGALLFLPWLVSPAGAAPSAGASDYTRAVRLLTAGKDFNQAITLLQSAVRAEPNNSGYHLALGCAYADRAASIGHAYEFADLYAYKKEIYRDRSTVLSQDQKSYYGSIPLSSAGILPPPAFTPFTKDDDKPFNLTDDQVIDRMTDLGIHAVGEWKIAVQLAGRPGTRAYAEYVQGEGMSLLSQYTTLRDEEDESGPAPTLPSYPSQDDAVTALRAAVKDAPNDALYWEALGAELYEIDFQSKEAIFDFRKSLALRPRRSYLWYICFDSESWRERETDEADLEHAEASDPNNALPWYLLAYLDTERTPLIQDAANSGDEPDVQKAHPSFSYEECQLYLDRQMGKSLTAEDGRLFHAAIAALETGNSKRNCVWPPYQPPIPSLLLPAWRYSHQGDGMVHLMSEIRELARAATGIVDVSAIEGHAGLAKREAQNIVDMGGRISRYRDRFHVRDEMEYIVNESVGRGIQSIGYYAALCVATASGDKSAIESARATYNASRNQGQVLFRDLTLGLQFDFPYWDY